MKFQVMNDDQHDRFYKHISNIQRKYSRPDNVKSFGGVLRNILHLAHYAGYPLMNIEYYPQPNVAVLILVGDDERRTSLTIYVRDGEFEVRYDQGSFVKLTTPREMARWLAAY